MRRRVVSVGSVLIAVAALAVVLFNATLVDRRGPAISDVTLSAPVDGQPGLAQTLTAIDLQFSEPVRAGTVERRFRIEPYVAGAITWDGSTATFTPSDKLPADTEFVVSVEPGFEDQSGNAAETGLEAFTFRTVGPPSVAATEPIEGADGVPVDAVLTITFDRLMDTTSVEEATRVEPGAAVRASWSGPQVMLAFDAPLLFGTTYTVTVGTTAADTDGSRLREPFSMTFTTVAAGLGVTETLPADGIAGISVRTPIAVVFDNPIDPETVEGALSITPPVGGELRVVPLPDDTDARSGEAEPPPATVLLFEPSDPLAAHTTYTVRLDSVVALDGRPDQVAAGRSWTFTTGQPTPSAHNHIAYLSVRGGMRDVWLMNPDGSAPRQLTTGLAPVSSFDVTADGTRIAWAAGGVVRLMAVDGTGETLVTAGGRFEYAPRFSPDGSRLLVARRDENGDDLGWWLVPLNPAADERQVLPDGAPPLGSADLEDDGIEPGEGVPEWTSRAAWDPDGRWIAVPDATANLSIVDLESDGEVHGTGLTAVSTVWSSFRAGFLAIGRQAGDDRGALWSVRTDGRVLRLADAVGTVAATDGGTVAVLVREGGSTRVALMRPGDRSADPITVNTAWADRWPTFSPDGGTVVFGRVRADDPTASAGIWTVPVNGGPAIPLTTDGAYPRWLP